MTARSQLSADWAWWALKEGHRAECLICGTEAWESFWQGVVPLFFCAECALDDLPKIIADAVCEARAELTEDDERALVAKMRRAAEIFARRRDGPPWPGPPPLSVEVDQ